MFKKTMEDGEYLIRCFTCNSCGCDIMESEPMAQIDDNTHICTECILKMTEGILKLNLGGWGIFWLKEMEQKYFRYRLVKRKNYLPKKLRNEIMKKYKFTCQNCGSKEDLTIDHIKPVKLGGGDEATNLTILCRICNSRKGAKYDN